MEELLTYREIKESIRNDLNSVAERFVSIGYQLKQVRDGELYKEDGYKDICEFAKSEYNIGKSNAYYFMKINDRFSVGGNSLQLIPEYEGYGSSKLTEMLNLDEEELKLVSDRATRDEIRVINQVKKEAEIESFQPAGKIAETIDFTVSNASSDSMKNDIGKELLDIVFEYFRDKNKRQQLIELGELFRKELLDVELEVAIIINPSGHSMFRKGVVVAFLEETVIKVKKVGSQIQEFTYTDFFRAAGEIFDFAKIDPWKEKFGEEKKDDTVEKESDEEDEDNAEESEKENNDTNKDEAEKSAAGKIESKKQIPIKTEKKVQKSEVQKAEPSSVQTSSKEDENIPGQMEVKDYPEYMPDDMEKVEGEVVLDNSHHETAEENPTEKSRERGQVVHELKIDHIYFADVIRGVKQFELRKNDRDFHLNDILRLHEQIDGQLTGRTTDRLVSYILENYIGLVEGYCIMGIQ